MKPTAKMQGLRYALYLILLAMAATETTSQNLPLFQLAGATLTEPISGLEESILLLAKEGRTPALQAVVAEIDTMITNDVIPGITHKHHLTQAEMNAMGDAFPEHCNVSVQVPHANLTNLSQAHKACRAEEAALFADMNRLCPLVGTYAEQMRAACLNFDGILNRFPSGVPAVCDLPPFRELEDHYGAIVSYFGNLISAWEAANETCTNATKLSRSANQSCQDQLNAYNAKKVQCDALQRLLDSSSCHEFAVADSCKDHVQCLVAAAESLFTRNSSISKQEHALKSEWQGMQRLLCYIQALNKSDVSVEEEIQSCQRKTWNTSFLNITYVDYWGKLLATTRLKTEPSKCSACLVQGKDYCIAENRCTERATYTCRGFKDHITGDRHFAASANPSATYAMNCPKISNTTVCAFPTVPQPGSSEYEQQEYGDLPQDAPAAPCASDCCIMCKYYPDCPNGTYRNSEGPARGYSDLECCQGACHADACSTAGWTPKARVVVNCSASPCTREECCDPVTWYAEEWPDVTCPTGCGCEALVQEREVHCKTNTGPVVVNESACSGAKPDSFRLACNASDPCDSV